MKARSIILFLCCCGVTTSCEAGGMFRRLPEVGEWVRFEHAMTAQTRPREPEKDDVDRPVSEPILSELTVKCVGEEEIDGVRHLWLELRWASYNGSEMESWVVCKLLVPADEIVDGDLMKHIVRGWWQSAETPVAAFDLSSIEHGDDPVAYFAYMAFPHVNETAGRREPKTVTFQGETVVVNHCVTGDIADRDYEEWSIVRDGASFWLSPDHGFGVVAVERTSLFENAGSEEDIYRVEYNSTTVLVETGKDAESDLPDNN